MVVAPDAVNCSAVFTPVPVAVFVLEITAPNVTAFVVGWVMEMSNPLPEVFAVEELVITKFSADTAVLPDIPRVNKFPLVIPVEENATIPPVPVYADVVWVTASKDPVVNPVEPRTKEFVVVLLFQFHVIILPAALAKVAFPVAAPMFVRVAVVDKV